MKFFITIFAALLSLFVLIAPKTTFAAPEHIRTANYFLMSGPVLDSAMPTLAQFDVIVIPAEAQEYNRSFFTRIRQANPDIVILAYVPTVSWNHAYWNDPLHERQRSGLRESYWLRDPQGNRVSVWPNTNALNLDTAWVDTLATFVKFDILASGLWDGIFYDEVMDSIDWVGPIDMNRDGTADAPSYVNAKWEAGNIRLFSQTRRLIGNDPLILINGSSNEAFRPYINGRMFETFPSTGSSALHWANMTNEYLSMEKRNDAFNIINVNTNNAGNGTNYQEMRFGLTTTLLSNGYYSYDFGTEDHSQLWTFDEYDVTLGDPLEEAQDLLRPTSSTIHQSVYERDFARGKVLVNGTPVEQTIQLEGDFEKLHGTQDPRHNDGSIVRKVTLKGQDGIVLVRPVDTIKEVIFKNGSFVRIFGNDGEVKRTGFFAYDEAAQGSDKVISVDVDNDGVREVVVADKTFVTIYEGDTIRARFAPFTEQYDKGINIAIGDLEGDGSIEIVVAAAFYGPQLRIYNADGNFIHPGFFAYDPEFRGGVNIAIGDLNGDGIKEIITGAGVGGGPHIRVANKDGRVINPGFFAYDESRRNGVRVAVGDIDNDGIDDIATTEASRSDNSVRLFNKDGVLRNSFTLEGARPRNGLDIAIHDIDNDGFAEILTYTSDIFNF